MKVQVRSYTSTASFLVRSTAGSFQFRGFLAAGVIGLVIVQGITPHAAFPGQNAKIGFHSNRFGQNEILDINPDGTNEVRITFDGGEDVSGTWSPDATRIAFSTQRDNAAAGLFEIYVMNADGTGQTRLTNDLTQDFSPAWSPDGTQITFTSDRDGDFEVMRMNADGSGQVALTSNPAADTNPTWSPDGTRIAFVSTRDDNEEVYVMDANGSNQTRLTFGATQDSFPDWSPDNAQITFASGRDGNPEIYVMDADGSNQTRLTNNPAVDDGPVFSPDGTQIAFRSIRDGNSEVYVMDSDGSNQTRVTFDGAAEVVTDWYGTPITEETVAVDVDTFLRGGSKNRNEGANPRLRIQATGNNRAVVGFDLTGIDTGAVTEATLTLVIAENANNWGSSGRTVDAHPLNAVFAEGDGMNAGVPSGQSTRGSGPGATWNCATDGEIANQQPNCAPQWGGGDFGSATAAPVLHTNGLTGAVEWDVTADVQAGVSGWLIKKTSESPTGKVWYYSKEGSLQATGDVSLAPSLFVSFN